MRAALAPLLGLVRMVGGVGLVGLVLAAVTAPFAIRKGKARYPTASAWLAWMLVMRIRPDSPKSRACQALRRQFWIVAYVGANGAGKTLCAVFEMLPTLQGIRWQCSNPDHQHTRAGIFEGERLVWSTTVLLDSETGQPHRLFRPIERWPDLLRIEHADVLLDEVTAIADARDSGGLPAQVRNLIAQLRKRDCTLHWTTPDFSNADRRLRQVTQIVVYAQGGKKVAPPAGSGQVWRQARLFRWSVYDAAAFDEFTAHRRNSTAPEGVQLFWRVGHPVERSFDSSRSVLVIGTAGQGGHCATCGGKRRAIPCTCPPDEDVVDVVQAAAFAEVDQECEGSPGDAVVVPGVRRGPGGHWSAANAGEHLGPPQLGPWVDAPEAAPLGAT